jgi:hypothetical protein
MSRAILALMAVLVLVNACGIRRPLMRPAEIPAYEKKRADKFKRLEEKPPVSTPAPAPDATTPDYKSNLTPTPSVPY